MVAKNPHAEALNAKLRLVRLRESEAAFPDGTVNDLSGKAVGKVRVKGSKDQKIKWSVTLRLDTGSQQIVRISCWCGPNVDVPHLQVAMDCKDGFISFCADLIPR